VNLGAAAKPQVFMPTAAGPQSRETPRAHSPRITTLASKLETATKVPSEFRIFASGDIRTKKGVFTFDDEAAEQVMKHAEEWGNDYSLDYDHGAFSLFSSPGSGMAAGWYKLEVRDGELWAVGLEWTEKARTHLEAREYRYFSPTFRHEEGGRIVELLNIALTNIPATKNMKPLMASLVDENPEDEDEETPPMKTLLAMLGLKDNATEAEAIAALGTERETASSLTHLTGKKTVREALAVVEAWRVVVGKYEEQATELSQLKQVAAKREMDLVVDEAKRAGKLPPAMEPHIRKMELSAAKAFLEAMPAVVKGGGEGNREAPHSEGSVALSAVEKEVCAQLGVKPEEFMKSRNKRNGEVDVAAITRTSSGGGRSGGDDEDDDE
jgi:phage I-like protein